MSSVAECYQLPPNGSHNLPEAVAVLRQQAYQDFQRRGLPTRKTEDWRYTGLTELTNLPLRLAKPAWQAAKLDGDEICLDGEHLTLPANLPAGLTVLPLAQGLARYPACWQHEDEVQRQWYELTNRAYLNTGWVIHVASEVKLTEPLNIVIRQGQQAIAQHCQCWIIAESGATLPVLTRFEGVDKTPYLNNCCCQVILASNANVNMLSVVQESSTGYQLAKLNVHQQADSHFSHHALMKGGALLRQDIDVSLKASGASSTLNGFYSASERQHMATYTSVSHLAPNTQSDEWYKGVVDDTAQAVFRGRVYVAPKAQKTNASQRNNNLLLSPKAEIDTKPQLEIFADDVKCAHGATVGQLDEAAIFYLRSRGITEAAAIALLVEAFGAEILQQLEPAFHHLTESLAEQFASRSGAQDASL